jgi:hypothetical protein
MVQECGDYSEEKQYNFVPVFISLSKQESVVLLHNNGCTAF